MQIRLAKSADLPAAAQLWFDRITLLQQVDPHVKLLPDAREKWSDVATSWIKDEQVSFLVGEENGTLVGFAVVEVAPGKPGMHPQWRGILLEMVLDLHETHRGLSDQLLSRAKRWLASAGVTQLEVDMPARYPVEAAFWRAQGAAACSERLRLPI